MREPTIFGPRVTPDPERAAELDRRMQELQYRPEVGFHRDRLQPRLVEREEDRPLPMLLRPQAG